MLPGDEHSKHGKSVRDFQDKGEQDCADRTKVPPAVRSCTTPSRIRFILPHRAAREVADIAAEIEAMTRGRA